MIVTVLPLKSAAQDKLITIGSTNPTGAAALPFVMAEKKGLFKKEGLNAATVIMQNAVFTGMTASPPPPPMEQSAIQVTSPTARSNKDAAAAQCGLRIVSEAQI